MKRLVIFALVMVFLTVSIGFTAKKTKVNPEQLAIKKAVLAWDDARMKFKKPTDTSLVKFGQVKVVSGWATTTLDRLKVKVIKSNGDRPVLGNKFLYLLNKQHGKWKVRMMDEVISMSADQCKQIGLPFKTAQKLKVAFWEDDRPM